MTKPNIHIPKPCHEDWSKMTSVEKGRHCNVCQKSVVDFTCMKDQEITNYLISKKEERVCGRFLSSQVTVKIPKHHEVLIDLYQKTENNSNTQFFKQFALLLIVSSMLLVGCEVPKKHKNKEANNPVKKEILKDSTIIEEHFTMGLPPLHTDDTIKPSTVESENTKENRKPLKDSTPHQKHQALIDENIMGDIEMNIDNVKEEVQPIKCNDIITGEPIIIGKVAISKDSMEKKK